MSGYSDREYVYASSRRGSSRPRTVDEEVYAQRRRSSAVAPNEVSVAYRHEEYDRDRGRSVSATRRQSSYVEQGPMVPYDTYTRRSSASTEAVSPRSRPTSRASSRTSVSQRRSSSTNAAGPVIAACGPVCADNAHRRASSTSSASSSASDLLKPNHEPYTAGDETRDMKSRRNKQLLYNGLAGVTTIAAANNIYQSSKAHRARQQAVRDGVMCKAEARHARNKALALDVAAVGIAAIGVNNAVNGWKKTNALRREDAQAKEKWNERREVRHEAHRMRKEIEGY